MKYLNLFILHSCFIINTIISQPSLQWESRYDFRNLSDQGKSLVLDSDKNVYVVGTSFGPGSDIALIKINELGDTLWTRRYNGPANGVDEPSKIKLDDQGNIYICGRSQGMGTGYDMLILKYSPNGILQWVGRYDGVVHMDDYALDFIVDNIGQVHLVGAAKLHQFNEGAKGILVVFNSSGQFVGQTVFDFGTTLEANNIITSKSGNLLISVYKFKTTGPGGFDPSENRYKIYEINPVNRTIIRIYEEGFYESFSGYPVKMDIDINDEFFVLYASTYSNPQQAGIYRFSVGRTTKVWFSYRYISFGTGDLIPIDFKIDPNGFLFMQINANFSDSYMEVIKYNYDGAEVDSNTFGKSNGIQEFPMSMVLDNMSNPSLYITGHNSLGDIYIIKYNSNLAKVWDINYDCGSKGIDRVSAMILDVDGNLYLTGTSNCNNSGFDVKTLKYCLTAPDASITLSADSSICAGTSITLSVNQSGGNNYRWSNGSTNNSITVSPSIDTTYWVTVTNSIGCHSIASQTILVKTSPTIPGSIMGRTLVCKNARENYTVSEALGATSYHWTFPQSWQGSLTTSTPMNTVRVGSNSGQITVYASNECGDGPAKSLNVFVTQIDTSLSVVNQSLVANETGGSYQWVNCDTKLPISGATDYSFTPKDTGNYRVVITKDGCKDSSFCYAVIVVSTSEANKIAGPQLFISPNPVHEVFMLELIDFPMASYTLDLFDMSGKVIKSFSVAVHEPNFKYEMQLMDIPDGSYCIKIKSSRFMKTVRFNKMK